MSYSENLVLQIIQKHLESVTGKVFLCSNDSDMINLFSNENLEVLSNPNQILSDYIDNLLLTKTFDKILLKYNQKFDTIIIHHLLEQIKYPELFLKNLVSILNDKGTIICSITNFFHITNIFNLLTGQILHNEFFNASKFYNLDKFLFLLNKNDMHVTKLSRIKKDFSSDQMNLDETLIPDKLINMIQKIPDYDTIEYVLMISKGKTVSTENLDFVLGFPKNYLLPKLQEFFDNFVKLEQGVLDKDKIISGYENSIKEQQEYIKNSIKEQRVLISGYENSIKEQREYIKNLEEHIHSLESQLKKFRFWKR